MNFIEKNPLPAVCFNCQEDCYNCDNFLDRWQLDPVDELQLLKRENN